MRWDGDVMNSIQVESVWEYDRCGQEDDPRFRVFFQEGSTTETGGTTTVYEITGADALQVIDWAQRHATGTVTWALALVVDYDDVQDALDPKPHRNLVWLVGADGNERASKLDVVQQRMLQRRGNPIQIPASDRMPDQHDVTPLFT